MKVLLSTLVLMVMGVMVVSGMEEGRIEARRVMGRVMIEKRGEVQRGVEEGERFGEGSKVYTGADGTMMMHFENGTVMRMYERGDVGVGKYRGGKESLNVELFLGEGKLLFEVEDMGGFAAFKVRTPCGVAIIRGTRGVVSYSEREAQNEWQMCVKVEVGEVEVRSHLDERDFIRKAKLEETDSLCFGGTLGTDGKLGEVTWALYSLAPPLPPVKDSSGAMATGCVGGEY